MKRFVVFSLFILSLSPAIRAQGLQNQVLGLLPPQTGEVSFLDVRALRGSPHYDQLKAQVLPDRFRALVQWTQYLGIDFDSDVHQLSWAFLPPDAQGQVGLVGIAEGNFPPDEVEKAVKERKLPSSRRNGLLVLPLGKNDKGQEFVFAFVDASTAVFGFREPVTEVLDRRTNGGQSLLNNAALVNLIGQVNGKSPVWIAMDSQFTFLAVKQMLPNAESLPGFEGLASRLQSSVLQFAMDNGMRGNAALRCGNGSDATLVSTLLQAGLAYQSWRLKDENPDLSRAISGINLNRENESVLVVLNLADNDFTTLLNKNSFALKF